MPAEVVLQAVDANGNLLECHARENRDVDRSVRIAFFGDDALTLPLLACVLAELPGAVTSCDGSPSADAVDDCRATAATSPATDQLCVVVVDGSPSPDLDAQVRAFLSQPSATALGIYGRSDADLPSEVRRIQAVAYRRSPCEATEDVLFAAGVGLDDKRAFISYAHPDAAAALHIAHELRDRKFSVFLDRQGIRPGDVWKAVLRDAIQETGLLVLVETPTSIRRRWVWWEIATALLLGASVIAVEHGASTRLPVPRVQFSSPAALTAVGEFADRQHRRQLLARRALETASLDAELLRRGAVPSSQGSFVTAGSWVALVDPRPGTARSFRRAADQRDAGPWTDAAVLSPRAILRAKKADQRFLASGSVAGYSTGSLRMLARAMAP